MIAVVINQDVSRYQGRKVLIGIQVGFKFNPEDKILPASNGRTIFFSQDYIAIGNFENEKDAESCALKLKEAYDKRNIECIITTILE